MRIVELFTMNRTLPTVPLQAFARMLKGPVAQIAAGGSGAGSRDLRRKGFAPAIEVNSLDTAKRQAAARGVPKIGRPPWSLARIRPRPP